MLVNVYFSSQQNKDGVFLRIAVPVEKNIKDVLSAEQLLKHAPVPDAERQNFNWQKDEDFKDGIYFFAENIVYSSNIE